MGEAKKSSVSIIVAWLRLCALWILGGALIEILGFDETQICDMATNDSLDSRSSFSDLDSSFLEDWTENGAWLFDA
jgi:hypothetical protein